MITKEDIKALTTYFNSLQEVPSTLETIVAKLNCMDTINDQDAILMSLVGGN